MQKKAEKEFVELNGTQASHHNWVIVNKNIKYIIRELELLPQFSSFRKRFSQISSTSK